MLPTEIYTLQTRLLSEDISTDDFFRFVNTTYEDEEVKEVIKTVLDNVQLEIQKEKSSKHHSILYSKLKSLFEDHFCEKIEDERYLQATDSFYDDGFIKEDETTIAFDLSLQEVSHPNSPEIVRKNKRKKPESAPVIYWLRRDLRIKDNPALNKAAKLNKPIIPVFLWSPAEEAPLGSTGAKCFWLEQSLTAFKKSLLDKYNCHLLVRLSSNLKKDLISIISETSATDIVWTALYEPNISQRDQLIRTALEDVGIKVHVEHSYLLHRPDQVSIAGVGLRGIGNVMHFMECCKVNPGVTIGTPVDPPKFILSPKKWPESQEISDLKLYVKPVTKDGKEIDWAKEIRTSWLYGEFGGFQYLRRFFDDNVEHYDKESSRADHHWTSELSPFLHWGQLSPRTILHEAVMAKIASKFRRKLAWRDLSYWLYTLFPNMHSTAIRPPYQKQWWSSNKEHLKAWQKGRTGYPLVDAAMRQIWRIGWTNNFMRHVVACFLISYLRINWVEGLRWFSDTLLDFDIAISSMLWQNAGMSGLDQWNFVLHPVYSSVTCDPQGDFVRKWVPELASLPAEFVHQPWLCSQTELEKYNVYLGKNYPERIVTDLESCRNGSIQDVTEARRNHGEGFIDTLNGRDRMEIPSKLLSEYMSSQDKKLMIPLITRNEFIYKTLNPAATDNPYDSVVTYSSSLGPVVRYSSTLGPELPIASRPSLPEHLCCTICKELCMRAIRLHCCNSQACRGCATKYVGKTGECWNCGKGNITIRHLVEDNAIRSAIREFRILPQVTQKEPFTGDFLDETPSFSKLCSQHSVAEFPRCNSTGTLMTITDQDLVFPRTQWRKSKFKKKEGERPILTRSREQSSESDQSKESDDDTNSSSSASSNSIKNLKQYIQPPKMSLKKSDQKYRSRSLSKERRESKENNYQPQSKYREQGRRESLQDSASKPKSRRESSEVELNQSRDHKCQKSSTESKRDSNDETKCKHMDKLKFNEVSVFFFNRTQGCVAIPRDGNFTIGMEGKHSIHQKWKIEDDDATMEETPEHKDYIEYDEQLLVVPANNKTHESEDESEDDEITFNFKHAYNSHIPTSNVDESQDTQSPFSKFENSSQKLHIKQEDITNYKGRDTNKSYNNINLNTERCLDKSPEQKVLSKAASESSLVTRKFNVSPVPVNEAVEKRRGECGTRGLTPLKNKQRIRLLKNHGVTSIDRTEADEIRLIRDSRRQCGCSCLGTCKPTTCECAINEIECQVENDGFPCACSNSTCKNPAGRRTFNETEVQLHYIQTMLHTHL